MQERDLEFMAISNDVKIKEMSNNFKGMNQKMDRLDKKFDDALFAIGELKDMWFLMKNDNLKEKEIAKESLKKWAEKKFAGKMVERIIYGMVTLILSSVAGSLIFLVIK